ncbi:hypothetical protein B7R21_06270 [Subtercola boreus]|uniref:Holin n=1 Tax=Subtercola boreus TaxID=120213 RepID=A0A3E0W0F5_9MICO|nr:hypothetical protein [Subtercola boreus]RFA14547.1 hypothetical protein B7R21_06270 [Subtercola boreus]
MTTTNPGNLGTIVTNALARKTIYGTYVIALVLAGGAQVAFATPGLGGQPLWLTVTLNVLAYCGVPIGGLALANTSNVAPTNTTTLNQTIYPPAGVSAESVAESARHAIKQQLGD